MAVLEAFVYDPLINWRLMQADVADTRRADGQSVSSLNRWLLTVVCLADNEIDPERAAELARVAAYPQGPTRKLKADENDIFNEGVNAPQQEVRNERALQVYNRVQHKLTGIIRDIRFMPIH